VRICHSRHVHRGVVRRSAEETVFSTWAVKEEMAKGATHCGPNTTPSAPREMRDEATGRLSSRQRRSVDTIGCVLERRTWVVWSGGVKVQVF
jgi:hypothetical protein